MFQRALVSVSDKTGLVILAKHLSDAGVEILSTGGTYKEIQHLNNVIEVSEYTGFPEMMGGRVKTLHPRIHAGILARIPEDNDVVAEHNIPLIDLVIVNLYPFAKTIAKDYCTVTNAIENIDIGGPTLLRGAAKNYKRVTVIVDPADYSLVLAFRDDRMINKWTRFTLAQKVFEHTAEYDKLIARYLGDIVADAARN